MLFIDRSIIQNKYTVLAKYRLVNIKLVVHTVTFILKKGFDLNF
jgi:hypothetical protein